MLSTPVHSADEDRANAVYDALLWALSRPGQVRALPEAGEGQIIDALIDRECRAHAADPRLMPALMRAGAEVAPIEQADHVFLGRLTEAGVLGQVAQGTDLYPDDGATLILSVSLGTGPRLRLTGPGVDGALEVLLEGLPDGFWTARAHALRYPMGFEIFLLDGAQVMGCPVRPKWRGFDGLCGDPRWRARD